MNRPALAASAGAIRAGQRSLGLTHTPSMLAGIRQAFARGWLTLAFLCFGTAASGVAQAQTVSGKWDFTAMITSTTCIVHSPPMVTLPRIQASALATPGQPSAQRRVDLKLTNCDVSVTQAEFTFVANPDPNSPTYFMTDTGPGHAQGVAIYLGTTDGTQLQANGTSNVSAVPVSAAGEATLQVFVGYVGNGVPVTPGNVNGRIEFDVNYR